MPLVPRLIIPCLLAVITLTASAEVFRDLPLSGGFRLSAVNTQSRPLEVGVVLQGDARARQEWRLAQWGTNFDLHDAGERSLPGGTRIRKNAGKKVAILPGGLAGEGVRLEVNGAIESSGTPRKKGQVWPHLLLEQKILKEFRIAAQQKLDFRCSFRVDHCTPATTEGLDPALHTAQVTAYWTLHNRNPESADHGEMIWFGVPLFDARHAVPQGHQAIDQGNPFSSGKFICTVEGSRFYSGPTGDGRWHDLSCDLVPLVREALAAAQTKGHLAGTRFDDLHATSFNIGWEVPGPYNCAITLKGLSLEESGQ